MALQYRQLSQDEAARQFPKRGHMDLTEYEAIFKGAQPGEAFAVELDGLSVRALKRRLGQAVKRQLGAKAALRYDYVSGTSALNFQVRPFAS